MSEVKRFYTISNSAGQPQRGWIMHKREMKWFFPLRGVTKIKVETAEGCRSKVEGGTAEDKDSNIHRSTSNLQPATYILDASRPQVLCVPPGNWFLIEQDGTAEVQVFSNCFVGEFSNDDFRKEI